MKGSIWAPLDLANPAGRHPEDERAAGNLQEESTDRVGSEAHRQGRAASSAPLGAAG